MERMRQGRKGKKGKRRERRDDLKEGERGKEFGSCDPSKCWRPLLVPRPELRVTAEVSLFRLLGQSCRSVPLSLPFYDLSGAGI